MTFDWKNMEVSKFRERTVDIAVEVLLPDDWIRYKFDGDGPMFHYHIRVMKVHDGETGADRVIYGEVIQSDDPDYPPTSPIKIDLDRREKMFALVSSLSDRRDNIAVHEWEFYVMNEIVQMLCNIPPFNKERKARVKEILLHLQKRGWFKEDATLNVTTSNDYDTARKRLKKVVQTYSEYLVAGQGGIAVTVLKSWDKPGILNLGRKGPIKIYDHQVKLAFSKFAEGFLMLADAFNVVEIVKRK